METIVKLVNSKSILQCDENEEKKHENEILYFFDRLSEKKEYECALLCQYQDYFHKKEDTIIKHCSLDEILNEIESFDIKNGLDIFIDDDNYFIIVVYGQGYSFKGEEDIVRVAIKILPFNHNNDFLDISEFVLFGETIKVSKQQFKVFSLYN